MEGLIALAQLGISVLLGGLLAIVAAKLLTGTISLTGLLEGCDAGGVRGFSPARAQLLFFTIFLAVNYLMGVVQNPSAASLPRPSYLLLGVLAGSQIVYLAGKAAALSGVRRIWHNLTKD